MKTSSALLLAAVAALNAAVSAYAAPNSAKIIEAVALTGVSLGGVAATELPRMTATAAEAAPVIQNSNEVHRIRPAVLFEPPRNVYYTLRRTAEEHMAAKVRRLIAEGCTIIDQRIDQRYYWGQERYRYSVVYLEPVAAE